MIFSQPKCSTAVDYFFYLYETKAFLQFFMHMIAGGEFSLFYTNCEKQTVVSFDIRVALYNVKANGYKDFLSVGEDMLPVVFMVGHCLSW